MSHPRPVPPLLTIEQLADRLGSSVRHVRRLVAERRVPYVKVVRFDEEEISAWLDEHRVSGRRAV